MTNQRLLIIDEKSSKRLAEYEYEGSLVFNFHGFYDFVEFDEVIRTLREEIKVEDSKFSGLDAMDGYSVKDGIRLNWVFNNWDCIKATYNTLNNDEAVSKIRDWTKVIYANLMKKFGGDSNA
jgi:hypothetical protein